DRLGVVTPSTRTWPAAIYGSASLAKNMVDCPPITDWIAWVPPLNGTLTICAPDSTLNSSHDRYGDEPTPDVEQLSDSGSRLASVISSPSVRAGTLGPTAR